MITRATIMGLRALRFLNTRIGRRLLAVFLATSLLPLVTMGWFAIKSSESVLQRQSLSVLRAAADGAEAQLREFLLHLRDTTLAFSEEPVIRDALGSMSSTNATQGSVSVSAELANVLRRQKERMPEAQEVFILDAAGRKVASSNPGPLGYDLSSTPCFARGKLGYFAGDVAHDPESGQISWVMSAPIKKAGSNKSLGVVALRIDPDALSDLTSGRRIRAEGADTQSFRMGKTGETYLVNRYGLMITESRYFTNAILNVKVDTFAIRTAISKGTEIVADYKDYRGVPVSGSTAIFPDMGWVLTTEIDFSQAFAPIRRLRNGFLALATILAVLVTFLAWRWAKRINRPLQMLKESEEALAAGDEHAGIVPERDLPADELGDFIRQRNVRVQRLSEQQRQLLLEQERRAAVTAELEQMSYSIMHDMRAPLRAITAFGGMIEAEAAARLNEQERTYLTRLKLAAARMDRLIVDVLNYSRIVRGDLKLSAVNVSDLLRGIVETYPALQSVRKGIHVPPDLPLVEANEAALTQCFSNLLDNAVKFTKPGQFPCINIKAELRDSRVRIWVEDDGIGIAEGFQERVFRMFQRRADLQEGTGIGLAIVRKAAERMGGGVGVISELDQGSRFWVELRLAGASKQPTRTSC
jgi:signal transduction histidine kinase